MWSISYNEVITVVMGSTVADWDAVINCAIIIVIDVLVMGYNDVD